MAQASVTQVPGKGEDVQRHGQKTSSHKNFCSVNLIFKGFTIQINHHLREVYESAT